MLVPLWGLYANMIAQILSQISSHFIIYYQRKVVSVGLQNCHTHNSRSQNMSETQTNEALCRSDFRLNGYNNKNVVKVKLSTNVFIGLLGILAIVLLVLGCSLTSFRLEILGITRKLIELGDDLQPAISNYSIFTIFGVIMEQALYLNSISAFLGLGFLALLLIITSLVVPCFHSLLLMVLWFYPTQKRMKTLLTRIIEILKAWQYVEVYIIAAFLGMWQIGDVSESLVESLCDQFESTFASFAYFGIIEEQNARCFYSDATMEVGAYFLLAASIILSWLSNFILEAEKQQGNSESNYPMINTSKRIVNDFKSTNTDFGMNDMVEEEYEEVKEKIRPLPTQFTDKFNWFLTNEQTNESVLAYVETVQTPRTFDGSIFEGDDSPRSICDGSDPVYTS